LIMYLCLLYSVAQSGGRGGVVIPSLSHLGMFLSSLFYAFSSGYLPVFICPSFLGSCHECGRMPCILVGCVLLFPLLLLCRMGILWLGGHPVSISLFLPSGCVILFRLMPLFFVLIGPLVIGGRLRVCSVSLCSTWS